MEARRSDRSPSDNEKPCPEIECPMTYSEAKRDIANPKLILTIPLRKSREVRTPRLTKAMMYADESPCIPSANRKASGTERRIVRIGPKEDRVNGRPRDFFNCGKSRLGAFLCRNSEVNGFLVINGVTNIDGFSFQRNYMLEPR